MKEQKKRSSQSNTKPGQRPTAELAKAQQTPLPGTPNMVAVSAITIQGANRRDLGDLRGLAVSIKEVGLLQPLLVDEHLDLVSGHRRLASAKKAGLTEVPVVRLDLKNRADFLLARLAENTHRQNPDPLEAGEVLVELKGEYEREHPETRRGATGGGKNGVGARSKTDVAGDAKPVPRFTMAVADKLGISESLVKTWLHTAELPDDRKRRIREAGAELRRSVAYKELKEYKEHRHQNGASKSATPDEAKQFRKQYDHAFAAIGHCGDLVNELVATAKRLHVEGVDLGEPPDGGEIQTRLGNITDAVAALQSLWSVAQVQQPTTAGDQSAAQPCQAAAPSADSVAEAGKKNSVPASSIRRQGSRRPPERHAHA